MIQKDVLKQVIIDQQKDLNLPLGIKRDKILKPLKNYVLIITGLRRCGKSTLLRQYLNKKSPIYYIKFEDLRLSSFQDEDFIKLDSVFEEVLGKNGIYFLDEVQNVKNWEIYVRKLVDSQKEVYITGSNSSLMSKELATRLTGRNISETLYPFSFNEYCKAKNKKPNLDLFNNYLHDGGIPEYVLQNDIRILDSLAKDIIYKDVLIRHKVREESVLPRLVTYLLSNIGKEVSYNKLKDLFGVGSANTIILLMDYLEDAYFLFTIKMFDYSLKKQIRNKSKVYCIDNGIVNNLSFKFSDNIGRLLENNVFIELKRRNYEIYFYKGNNECDFIIKNLSNKFEAIQVCYELDYDNKKREINGLVEACKNNKLNQGLILTFTQEDNFVVDNIKIVVKPVWKWSLEN